MSLAQFAADVLGDSHGLDQGRAVATIVLRACAASLSIDAIEAAGLQDAREGGDRQDEIPGSARLVTVQCQFDNRFGCKLERGTRRLLKISIST